MNTGLSFCRRCGNSLAGRTRFCGHCGTRIMPVAVPVPARPLRNYRARAVLSLVALLTGAYLVWHTPPSGFGSDPSRADKDTFAKVIDAQLARDCIFIQPTSAPKFPVSIVTDGVITNSLRQLEALTKVGLLTSVDDQVAPPVSGKTYSLTELGKHTLWSSSSNAFCAGHYAVDEVLEFTIPGPAHGGTVTEVSYSFSPHDVPRWAMSAEVQTAFPGLAKALAPKQTSDVYLVLTNHGWVPADE
ncbi:MAG: zinc ribbon domain-containing protein [Deltaproteobacteria bacterium]|nr:zinc ribbon domain-containing protein [Deltaproteobacteria bacterium]